MRRVLLVVALLLAPLAWAQKTDSTTGAISRAIMELSASDPDTRQAAADALLHIGPPARPALLRATRDEDPAVRAAASTLLRKLPWFLPTDPPEFRDLLTNYGRVETEGRIQIIGSLAQMPSGFGVMARLIVEEPDDSVKWAIVEAVRQTHAPAHLDLFRALKTESGAVSAPLLGAAGHAWFAQDASGALKLLERALDLHLQQPSNDNGEIAHLASRLASMAILADRPDHAAAILRRVASLPVPEDQEITAAILDLFAHHGSTGSLSGLAEDVQRFEKCMGDDRILYCIGRAYGRAGGDLLGLAIARSSLLAANPAPGHRTRSGNFFYRTGWLEMARLHWSAIVTDPGASAMEQANAHFRLSMLAANEEEDTRAAEHLRRALALHRQGQGELRGTSEAAIEIEILWRDLRGARQKNGKAARARAVDALLAAIDFNSRDSYNPDVAIDLIQVCEELGRKDDADRIFQTMMKGLQAELAADPYNAQNKNNIAWLCARVGRDKQRALKLAREAVALVPDNAALMDTLAEAYFQTGNAAEALQIEERAVRLRPWDLFLKKQVARFKAGVTAR